MKGLYILAGLVSGVCITLCMGQGDSDNLADTVKVEAVAETVEKPALEGQNGRYQISAGPVTGVFIVDTQTGQVWRCLREDKGPIWYDYGSPGTLEVQK